MLSKSKWIGFVIIVSWGWLSCDTESTVNPYYQKYFIKYYGEDGDQEAVDLVANPDGSIIIVGNTRLSVSSNTMFVVKTDAEGNVEWQRRLGVNNESAKDVEPILAGPDAGNFVVLSDVRRPLVDSVDIRLTIISPAGDSLRSVLYTQYESKFGKSVTNTPDGGYLVSGLVLRADTTNVELPGLIDRNDVLHVKFSSTLSVIYTDRIGGSSLGSGIRSFESLTSRFQAEYTDELDVNTPGDLVYESNFVFRNLDLSTNIQKTFYAGNPNLNEEMAGISTSPSGNFLAVGTQFTTSGSKRLYAALVINNFNLVQDQRVIGPDNLEGVNVCSAGGSKFIVVGNKIGPGGRNIWVARVDTGLNVEFEIQFGGSTNNDRASAVTELPSGDILVLGTMDLSNQDKIALIKLKANGQFE
ncbi:MAG: hypothetical protein ACK4RF_09005 [Cyclobacteriaceae bacterium]